MERIFECEAGQLMTEAPERRLVDLSFGAEIGRELAYQLIRGCLGCDRPLCDAPGDTSRRGRGGEDVFDPVRVLLNGLDEEIVRGPHEEIVPLDPHRMNLPLDLLPVWGTSLQVVLLIEEAEKSMPDILFGDLH